MLKVQKQNSNTTLVKVKFRYETCIYLKIAQFKYNTC